MNQHENEKRIEDLEAQVRILQQTNIDLVNRNL